MAVITFTKVKLPYGWLGNMSAHPVVIGGVRWRTAEHAFQAFRFPEDHPIRESLLKIKSPMEAKLRVKPHRDEMEIEPCSEQDLALMRQITWSKLIQNDLEEDLLSTGDAVIVEDVTKRQRGNSFFWGAALIDGEWTGDNWLGRIWMEHRNKLKS